MSINGFNNQFSVTRYSTSHFNYAAGENASIEKDNTGVKNDSSNNHERIIKRAYTLDELKKKGLSDEDIAKYFKHDVGEATSYEDHSVKSKFDNYTLNSRTIDGIEYKTEEEAINAILNKNNSAKENDVNALENFLQDVENSFLNNNHERIIKRAYTLDELKKQGLSDEDIAKYFKHDVGEATSYEDHSVKSKFDNYTLNSRTVDGIEYKTEEEAIKAIVNKHKTENEDSQPYETQEEQPESGNDTDGISHFRGDMNDFNFKPVTREALDPNYYTRRETYLTEDEIQDTFSQRELAKYFDYDYVVRSRDDNRHDVFLAYILKSNVEINGVKIKTVEELMQALGK